MTDAMSLMLKFGYIARKTLPETPLTTKNNGNKSCIGRIKSPIVIK